MFFCAPRQGDNPSPRIAKAAVYDSTGTKSGESVCVGQPARLACLGHRQIMPDFSSR
jgi:hypothetical protein